MPWLTAIFNSGFRKPENWDEMIERLMVNTALEFGCSVDQVEYREITLSQSKNAFTATVQLEFSVPNIWKLLGLRWRMNRLLAFYVETMKSYQTSRLRPYGLTIRPLIFAQFRQVGSALASY